MGWVSMTEADDVYRATIGELLEIFRDALAALIPLADRAKMNYRDIEPHRDWERLAESLFDAFVRSPIESDRSRAHDELPLARYDIDLDDYLGKSWLGLASDSGEITAIVRFLSYDDPFDTAQIVEIDPATLRANQRRTVPLSEVVPVLYRRRERGSTEVVTQVEAVE